MLPYFSSVHVTPSLYEAGFLTSQLPRLYGSFHSPLMLSSCVPTVLVSTSTGISTCRPSATLFSLTLGPELPQSRSALLWKPWIFGRKDSHLTLATHSGILSSINSTTPFGMASPLMQCSSTNSSFDGSSASVSCFSPGNFRRGTSRPVSYYALFQCVAASEPTSWLSWRSYILSHLTRTLGP